MLNAPLPRIPDTQLIPLYRAEAFGLELSEDYLDSKNYAEWVLAINYQSPMVAAQ